MTKTKIYIHASIIMLCGYFLIKPAFSNSWTEGVLETMTDYALWIIICGVIANHTLIWYSNRIKVKYNPIPIAAVVIVTVFYFMGNWYKNSKINGPNNLVAINKFQGRTMLKLQENRCYLLERDQIEWASLFYTGKYKISNDTIFLAKNFKTLTQNTFYRIYVFQKNNKCLVPIYNGKAVEDSAKWLTVEPPDQDK